MKSFIDLHQLDFLTHIPDVSGDLWRSYGISRQPSWIFVSATGEVERGLGTFLNRGY